MVLLSETWIYTNDVVDFKELKEGQVIKVWVTSMIRESMPPQTVAEKMEIIKKNMHYYEALYFLTNEAG